MSNVHLNIDNKNNDNQNMQELQLDTIHQQNSSYLHLFELDLHGLAPKTIKCHLQNIDFFS